MIDESENRSSRLNEQRDRKKREITGDESTSRRNRWGGTYMAKQMQTCMGPLTSRG